ncbi:MAG: UvrD-helicase domain-containing protein, partial [Treponema maltophilum]
MNEANCVVAAGAGSGKTFVFARRFAHLIVDKGFAVDTILALTFTKKAAAVMYSRSYALLKKLVESEDAHSLAARRARTALENFHKARIQTLDSYCAFILRTASRLYGIRPDFSVDDVQIREFINKEALAFTLGHKDNPSLQSLLGVQSLDKTAADFFAAAVLNYSTIARPFDFETAMEKQRAAVQSVWGGVVKTVNDCAPVLADTDEDSAVLKKLEENLTDAKAVGEYMSTIADTGIPLEKKKGAEKIFAQKIVSFASAVYILQKKSARTARYKDALNELRPAYNLLTSRANYLLHFGDLCSLVPLLQEFEKKVNDRKRASGLLSFKDISSLALRILLEQPAVRCAEKKRLNAIMIDEFQDNNEQQRDMLFLLAEKIERTARSAPRPDELCPDKLFFVGDEKQSIYLFRGADVSVFRKLKEDLASKDTALSSNYRSSSALIGAFNALFGGFCGTGQSEQAAQAAKEGSLGKNPALLPHSVFLQKERFAPGIPFPPFEAEYTPLTVPEPASPAEDAQTGTEASVYKNSPPPVHVCLL